MKLLNEIRDSRIPIDNLEHRKLYKLHARNIKIGVWFSDTEEFIGIRDKLGRRFLDGENHWDAKDFATACPLEVIGELPDNIIASQWSGFNEAEQCYEYNKPLKDWLEIQELIHCS